MKKKLLKLLLFNVWQQSRRYAEIIRERGPEEYAEYTADFIFGNVLDAYKATFRMLKWRPWKWWRLWLVPKIYFEKAIQPIIAKFPVRRTAFQKLGRNDRILIRDRKTGMKAIIKKKFYDENRHELLEIVTQ